MILTCVSILLFWAAMSVLIVTRYPRKVPVLIADDGSRLEILQANIAMVFFSPVLIVVAVVVGILAEFYEMLTDRGFMKEIGLGVAAAVVLVALVAVWPSIPWSTIGRVAPWLMFTAAIAVGAYLVKLKPFAGRRLG